MALGYLDDSKLYAIASAIRAKTGDSSTMTVDDMPDEIGSISTGAQVEPLSVTENGTYSAPTGYAYSPVMVDVSGGGLTMDDVAMRKFSSTINLPTAETIAAYAFYAYAPNPIVSFAVNAPNVDFVGESAFYSCSRLSEITIPNVSGISGYAFRSCGISSISAPKLSRISQGAFYDCSNLSTVYAPNVSIVASNVFYNDIALKNVDISACQDINGSAFFGCHALTNLSLPNVSYIGNRAFANCFNFTSLDLTGVGSVPRLGGSQAFSSTPIGGYSASAGRFGSVYVPSSLYASFTAAQYWSLITSRIVSV